MTGAVQQALEEEIKHQLIKVEDCPQVNFKPIEALFENEPRQLKVDLLPIPAFPLQLLPEKIGKYFRAIARKIC